MTNEGHPFFHQYRESNRGELGVLNRTYLTSKDRATKAEQYYTSIQPDRPVWNEKRQVKGNFMRPVQKIDHKNAQIKHKKFDECARVTAQVAKTGRDYLPESFDLYTFENPVWKTVDRKKWLSPKGMDVYGGSRGAHVGLQYSG